MKLYPAQRSQPQKRSLHSLEKALVFATAIHLVLMPWALGTMWWYFQFGSMLLSACALAVSLIPRNYQGTAQAAGFTLILWPKLFKFPIFWFGLGLILIIIIQGLNPDWIYMTDGTHWWLQSRSAVAILPHGIDAPFLKFNSWRQLIIYADAWFLSCSLWVGVTERRSLRIILESIVINAAALGGVLLIQRLSHRPTLPFARYPWTEIGFVSTFVYKNHAGAYFALSFFIAIGLAARSFEHGRRTFKRSTPTIIWAMFAGAMAGAVLLSSSRGAAILSLGIVLALGAWLVCWYLRSLDKQFRFASILAVLLVAAVSIALISKELIHTRFFTPFRALADPSGSNFSVHSRTLSRQAALDMLRANFGLGVGAGDFRYLFPEFVRKYPEIYQRGSLFWQHAHCDLLEIPIELGLAGSCLLAGSFFWAGKTALKSGGTWNPLTVALLAAGLGTIAHASFDFPFQCPAVLACWCAIITITAKLSDLNLMDSRKSFA